MGETLDREQDWNQVNTHISYANVLARLVTLPEKYVFSIDTRQPYH
jgi:hypothetical protein